MCDHSVPGPWKANHQNAMITSEMNDEAMRPYSVN